MLDLVVVRFQLIQAEWPILNGRAFRNSRRAVTPLRFAHDFEVPGIEPPTLSPVVERRPADRIHHWMKSRSRGVRSRSIRPMCRNLTIRFLHGLRPAAIIVPQLIGSEVAG